MIRRVAWTLAGSVAAAIALLALDAVDVARAAILVVVALAVSLAFGLAPADDAPWPQRPTELRAGGRKDVSELAWAAFTRDGNVTERLLRRVRHIAARRLADHGVRWDARLGDGLDGWGHDDDDAAQHRARAADLLGPDLLAALCRARAVSPRTLEYWLRALDHLVEAPDDARSAR